MNSSIPPFSPFTYKNLEDLSKVFSNLNLKVPISSDVSVLKTHLKLGNKFIANRLVIQPMEGFDSNLNGAPSKYTFRRYRRYAKSGVGLIWFEATAISTDCRSNEHQLILHDNNLNSFKKLVSKVRQECDDTLKSLGFRDPCVLVLQLNHSGRYTKRKNKKYPLRATYNKPLDSTKTTFHKIGEVVTDGYLKEVEDLWIEKTLLAERVGFDGVDIKACHGYLIDELLGSRTRQNSIYGGPELKNRSRLLMNIIKRVKNKIKNSNFIITSRLGIYDGISYPYGFGVKNEKSKKYPVPHDLTEPIKILELLQQLGVRLVNITAGDPHFKPFITRPFDTPVKGESKPPEHPLYSLNRLIQLTSLIKHHFRDKLVVLGSGYTYLRQFAGNVIAGLISENNIDLGGFGRMSFANPKFAAQIFESGNINNSKVCITCSKCSQLMRLGKRTGCSIRDPLYKNSINSN